MKLFLSSKGFLTRSQFQYLVGKKYEQAHVGVIMNAVDWRTPAQRQIRYRKIKKLFRKLRIEPDILDLRTFYDRPTRDLIKRLRQFDIVWVRGGNCFFLRYVMKRSGFDQAIKSALRSGLVYAGESAGALVVGPTLKYIDQIDELSTAPRVIWRGIHLTQTMPLPHWGYRPYHHALKRAYIALVKEHIKVVKLPDGEALLVTGHSIKKVRTNKYWR